MSFQSFRQSMMRLPDSAYQQDGIPNWGVIRIRVLKKLSKEKSSKYRTKRFRKLSLALAKYDYFGAPSNWMKKYKHQDYIVDWAKNVTDKDRIQELVSELKKGLIPDAFEEMIDNI